MLRSTVLVAATLFTLALMPPVSADEPPAGHDAQTAIATPEGEEKVPANEFGPSHDEDGEELGVPSDPLSLFHRMDETKDGSLDKFESVDAEFLHHFGHVHGGPTADVPKIIGAMDKDKNAKVDAEEFLAYVAPIAEVAFAKGDFDAADTDGDKHLNYTEWQYSAHAMDGGIPAPGETLHDDPEYTKTLSTAFGALDTDNDKKVSLQEYLNVQGKDQFSQIDTDG